jgi:hypothetical protein
MWNNTYHYKITRSSNINDNTMTMWSNNHDYIVEDRCPHVVTIEDHVLTHN